MTEQQVSIRILHKVECTVVKVLQIYDHSIEKWQDVPKVYTKEAAELLSPMLLPDDATIVDFDNE